MHQAFSSRLQLVLNVGSSSVKYALYRQTLQGGNVSKCIVPTFAKLVEGLAEGIGLGENAVGKYQRIKHVADEKKETIDCTLPDHQHALNEIMRLLQRNGALEISSVGHRIVHGGEKFKSAAIVDDLVLNEIDKASALAPLHNPFGALGIRETQKLLPGIPNVAVFDTAFHQTIEPHVYMYALPKELYEKHSVRKYGFHGTSYQYVLSQLSEVLQKPQSEVNAILCHVGNGASMCCIKGGRSVDTTMGMTPLEGLVMGTRSGDIDPAIIEFLVSGCGYSFEEVTTMLNKSSGLLGLCGTSDDREIEMKTIEGDPVHTLGKKVQVHRMRRYLGAFLVQLGGKVDAIAFCGGLGEKSSLLRTMVCEDLEELGIKIDEALNNAQGGRFSENTFVGRGKAKTEVWVIPTDEESCIAEQTYDLCHKLQDKP